MNRATPDDQELLRGLARVGGASFRAAARAILDLQDALAKPQPEPMTATRISLQTENYVHARRIDEQDKCIADLQAKLQKAQEGWEKAGREAAQNLARAVDAETRADNYYYYYYRNNPAEAVECIQIEDTYYPIRGHALGMTAFRKKYQDQGKAAEFERIVDLLDDYALNDLVLTNFAKGHLSVGAQLYGADLRAALKDTAK